MLSILLLCIIAITLFQVGVLLFCWYHRKDALLVFPIAQRRTILGELVKIDSDLEAMHVFATAILSKGYGKLNLSQTEFTHQIIERSQAARKGLSELLDPSQPMEEKTTLSNDQKSDAIVHYLRRRTSPKHTKVRA